MHAKLLKALADIRASYWFIPSLMSLAAVAMAIVLTTLDSRIDPGWIENISWLYANQPAGARAVLSTIAGSMITVAGVTFSMTIVAVSFAAGQLGPRLIGNFMRDRSNQITLGTFIGTFIYCIIVLRTVRDGESVATNGVETVAAFVPQSAILWAIVCALVSVGVLINFIHHIPESINVSNLTAGIGRELILAVEDLFPSKIGEPVAASRKDFEFDLPDDFYADATPIDSATNGYIQVLDEDELLNIATEHDIVIRVEYRPGDFVTTGKTLLLVWPPDRVDEELAQQCRHVFALGIERTPRQNIMFSIEQLIEIIARALSPGINDPYTALSCIDWLQAVLNKLLERDNPSSYRMDDAEKLRIITHPVTFELMLNKTLDQLQLYCCADRIASLRLQQMIAELLVDAPRGGERSQLLLQRASYLNTAAQELLPLKRDREEVERRHGLIARMLEDEKLMNKMRDTNSWLEGTA